MFDPREQDRLYEHVVEQIKKQILSGQLKPGDQLASERELSKQFGVSRTAIREALKALRESGLVVVQLGRGTFVIDDTSRAAKRSLNLAVRIGHTSSWVDLVEVRQIVEPEIAALAALRATPDQVAAMYKTLEALSPALGSVDRWAEADTDFHIILAEASQNAVMSILLDSVVELLHDQRRQLLLLEGRLAITYTEHKRIIDAVARHDADAARESMRAHIERVRRDVQIIVEGLNDSGSSSAAGG